MKKIEKLLKNINVTPDGQKHEDGLKAVLHTQEQNKKNTPAVNQPTNIGMLIMKHNFTKLAAAAVIILALLITFSQNGVSPDGATVAWADVVERFRAVTSFEATVYLKNDAISEPEQIELWVGKNGGTRLRSGSNVIFGKNGNVIRAYDIKTRKTTRPNERETGMVSMLNMSEFSLNSIVDTMLQGRLKNVTPIVNMDENISADITVFDLESEDSRHWIRIWALRESKLPTRMKMFDPESGEAIDAIFTYTKDQPDEFYDANAYWKFLQKAAKQPTIVYGGLIDPDENDVSPNVRSDHEVLKVVTTTLDGQPWSVAEKLKDKNIVLFFWSLDCKYRASDIKDKYLKILGDRGDFVFVSVILSPDTNAVKNFVRKNNIPGLHLQEPGKGFTNSLAKALGINQEGVGALIEKDGFVFITHAIDSFMLKPMIDYMDNGLNHYSLDYASTKIRMLYWKNKEILTKEYVEKLMQNKGKVSQTEKGEKWEYTLIDKKKENGTRYILSFDKDNQLCNIETNNWMIGAGAFKFKITQDFWDKQIIPKFNRELLPENNKNNYFSVQLWPSGIKTTHPKRSFAFDRSSSIVPEKQYHEPVRTGVYDIVISLMTERRGEHIEKIILAENVEIKKHDTVEIVFDKISE